MDLSLVIPTYNESGNIKLLIENVNEQFLSSGIDGEIIIVDDNSPDGTGELVEGLRGSHSNLKVLHRKGKLGLSSAVIHGFGAAEGNILGVMDADLSHPPEAIPALYSEIMGGADFVIGSRYAKGGSIENWNLYRKFISRGASSLARMFTRVADPMSGFFMIRKGSIQGREFNSKGFKICLELLVKADYKTVKEVPISFTDRKAGSSKAGVKEYFFLLENLFGYMKYKNRSLSQMAKFAFVGGLGAIVNLAVFYSLTQLAGVYYILAAIASFACAVTFNFTLNKVWTFGQRLRENTVKKYAQFLAVSVAGLSVNITLLYILVEYLFMGEIVAQILSIGVAFVVNFSGNKLLVFRTGRGT